MSAAPADSRTKRPFAERWRDRLLCEWWSIGICEQSIGLVLESGSLGPVRWLAPRRGSAYRADPFVWPGTGRVLCEEVPLATGIGRIVVLREEGGDFVPEARLLDDGIHRSYPFVWTENDAAFVLPEASAGGPTILYQMAGDGALIAIATIAPSQRLVDATLFSAGGYQWIAATDCAYGSNNNLCLFYADRIAGPWHPHRGNPVKRDISSARPGGTPFRHREKLFRPAQDCTGGYGAALVINEIVTLTPDAFEEHIVCRLAPDPRGPFPDGLHTLSSDGTRCFVDGKRLVFVPMVVARKIGRRLHPGRLMGTGRQQ